MSELLTNALVVNANNGGTISSGATSLTVTYISGATGSIPAVSSQIMRCYWEGELIEVTAASGGGNVNWTIVRGVEGTTAISHLDGSAIYQILTVGGLQQYVKDNSSVTSFNTRIGAVTPATNDYAFSQLSGSVAAAQTTHYGVSVYGSAQVFTHAVSAAFSYTAAQRDDGGFYNHATHPTRLTVPSGGDGWYALSTSTRSGGGTYTRVFVMTKNGISGSFESDVTASGLGEVVGSMANCFSMNAGGVAYLVATDFLEVFYQQQSGSNETVSAFYFSMARIN